jgi:hypothetical protein
VWDFFMSGFQGQIRLASALVVEIG